MPIPQIPNQLSAHSSPKIPIPQIPVSSRKRDQRAMVLQDIRGHKQRMARQMLLADIKRGTKLTRRHTLGEFKGRATASSPLARTEAPRQPAAKEPAHKSADVGAPREGTAPAYDDFLPRGQPRAAQGQPCATSSAASSSPSSSRSKKNRKKKKKNLTEI